MNNKPKAKITATEKTLLLLALLGIATGFIALAREEFIWTLVFNLVLLVSGVYGLRASVKPVRIARSSASWPKVSFSVENAHVALETGAGARTHTRLTPDFDISYSYEGKAYSRNYSEDLNLGYTQNFGTLEKANNYIEEVRNGFGRPKSFLK